MTQYLKKCSKKKKKKRQNNKERPPLLGTRDRNHREEMESWQQDQTWGRTEPNCEINHKEQRSWIPIRLEAR